MKTFYFHTEDAAKAFADMLCINFKSGSTTFVRPTTPFDGWFAVELTNATQERMARAKRLWLELEYWPKDGGASAALGVTTDCPPVH